MKLLIVILFAFSGSVHCGPMRREAVAAAAAAAAAGSGSQIPVQDTNTEASAQPPTVAITNDVPSVITSEEPITVAEEPTTVSELTTVAETTPADTTTDVSTTDSTKECPIVPPPQLRISPLFDARLQPFVDSLFNAKDDLSQIFILFLTLLVGENPWTAMIACASK